MSRQADVVVVGAGVSGIGTALTLAEAGKKVVMLEKGNKPGGAGMFGAEGLFAVESQAQKNSEQALDQNYTVKDAYQELTDYSHDRTNLALTKAILQESAETIAWLGRNGLQTELVNNTQEVHQEHPRVYHQYIDKFQGFQNLLDKFTDLGGVLLTETAAVGLLTEAGQISGIEIEHAGQKDVIDTQIVIIGDGGYVGNPEMVAENLAIAPKELNSMGERKATGDGIKMLAALGADTSSLGVFENHAASAVSPTDPKWNNNTIFTLTNLPFLWVNRTGSRFVNEDVCYDFALWGNITYTQGGYYYYLLNEKQVEYLETNQLDWTNSFERTFTSLSHQPVTHQVGPFPTIKADLEDAIANGLAWQAEDLDGLASQLGVSASNLKKTVARYDTLVAQGADEDFYKQAKFMKFAYSVGPYYAVRAGSTTLGTIGGLAVNDKLQALKNDGTAIPGAFAVGNNAAGMYDTSYPTIEGVSCAFAWNSGRLAAKSVLELLEQGTEKYYG